MRVAHDTAAFCQGLVASDHTHHQFRPSSTEIKGPFGVNSAPRKEVK